MSDPVLIVCAIFIFFFLIKVLFGSLKFLYKFAPVVVFWAIILSILYHFEVKRQEEIKHYNETTVRTIKD